MIPRIDAWTIWYFKKRLLAVKAPITRDSIGLSEVQELEQGLVQGLVQGLELVDKIPGNKPSQKFCEKLVRLKNLLRDIHNKPMDEQYNYIKSNFFLWKEDLEQVDDVLFMGIKL
ncbi:MAG: hypothetical protein KAR19_05560 [Bacteroidales bacterium]|nr:hypothetical protein [Bacteroidales bacterium]